MYSKLGTLSAVILLGSVIFLAVPVAAQKVSQTFTSSGTFTIPAGVTKIDIEAWGGGGGGAGGSSVQNETSGGGGGGGGYVIKSSVSVIPGNVYTVTVGTGGAGGTNASFDGLPSSVSIGGIIIVEAGGGKGGTNATSSVPGVGGIGGKGTFNGGSGANGVNGFSGFGGGGGSSGGVTSNGNDGAGMMGGAVSGGGKGGNGGPRNEVGLPGSIPGGGGGGGSKATTNRAGGNGARGQVIISWTTCTAPTISADDQPKAQSIVYGSNASFTVSASGDGALTYQWEVSTPTNLSWATLADNDLYSGVNAATLILNRPPASLNGNKYRVVVAGCTPIQTTPSNGLATLNIAKAPLTVVNHNRTKAYGEELTNSSFSGSISGIVPGDDIQVERSCSGALSTAAVGTYTIIAHLLDPNGRLTNYEVHNSAGELTVEKVPLTVSANDTEKVYDGAGYHGGNGVTYSGFVNGESATVLTGAPTYSGTAQGAVYAGSYSITPEGLGSENYAISYVSGALTIKPRELVVAAKQQSKTYGNADPLLDFEVTAGSLAGEDDFTGELSREYGENVGTYTIDKGTLSAGNNYSIIFKGASFTITPRPASVTPSSNSKVYGSGDPVLGGVLDGFLEKDHISATYHRAEGETVGANPYTITAVLSPVELLSNYHITYHTTEFTITPKSAFVKPFARSKTYGQGDPQLSGELSGFLESDGVEATYTRTLGETVSGGPYAITAALKPTTALTNYEVTYYTAPFNILPKEIRVTADAKKKMINQPDPLLTFTDNDEALKPEDFSGSLERMPGEEPGEYIIQEGTLALNENYKISYTPATLRIYDVPVVSLSTPDPVMVNHPSVVRIGFKGEVFHAKWIYSVASSCGVQEIVSDDDGKLTNGELQLVNPAPVVYAISLAYKDAVGQEFITPPVYAVFYDPNAGFVTGGGWITSPPGALKWNPSATGKANFGFVAKYKKGSVTGAMEGETEFQFQAGNLKFQSTSYEAATLVIGGYKASYRGYGTINGSGLYKFTLVATDGQLTGGGGTDKIRMKITSMDGTEVIYDNQGGFAGVEAENADPNTALSGGSIMIHTPPVGGKKSNEVSVEARNPEVFTPTVFSFKSFPNPSMSSFNIQVESNNLKDKIILRVLDVYGRTVEVINSAVPGQTINVGGAYRPGIYFVEVIQGSNHKHIKLLKQAN